MRRWGAALLLAGTLLSAEGFQLTTLEKLFEALKKTDLPAAEDYDLYDPFQYTPPPKPPKPEPPVAEHEAQKLPVLQAIINHSAFMDGRWVRVGDRLGVFKVVAVGPKGVQLLEEHRLHFIAFGKARPLIRVTSKGSAEANATGKGARQ